MPNLFDYDVSLVNSSAGKDSQAMLSHLIDLADAQRVSRSRFVVVHADLGRVEWAGTRDLAERQAAAYGLRFEVVQRDLGDLLDQVKQRRTSNLAKAVEAEAAGDLEEAARRRAIPSFPSSEARWCTSDQKTSQVKKLMTRLAAEHREAGYTRPLRILNCLGIRAEESDARAKKTPFGRDSATGKGQVKVVDRWLPIFDWTVDQVWDKIRESGLPYHPAYDLGMERLSCVFCVLAKPRDLEIAARHNPALAREYAAVEVEVESRFTDKLSMAEVIERASDAPAA